MSHLLPPKTPLFVLAWLFLFIVTIIFYWLGISTSFILDDNWNLSSLEAIKTQADVNSFWQFVLEGSAGSLGRPISLFSFALQAQAWPNASVFKILNILIHIINGGFIFTILYLILLNTPNQSKASAFWLSYLTCALWLLHPMQVSTVLYVIQRMAQLSTLFTLLGVLLYVIGRLAHQETLKSWLLMSIGVGIGGILATLSKENGILLPLYILSVEFTLLQHLPRPHGWFKWASIFCFAPIAILLIFFISHPHIITQGYVEREFSLWERVLTELRILLDYVGTIFFPQSSHLGLFHDDYPISTGILTPISTAISGIIIIILFIVAIHWRKQLPVFAFALFWFLSGHLLESTVIPLMLYFEHRNYLAMLGILFALSYAFFFYSKFLKKQYIYLILVGAIWSSGLLFVSYTQITLWQQPLLQALYWAEQKPYSRFAQYHAASMLLEAGHPQHAFRYVQHIQTNYPQDTGYYAFWLVLSCQQPNIPPPDFETVHLHFQKQGQSGIDTIKGMDAMVKLTLQQSCSLLSQHNTGALLDALLTNPKITHNDKAVLMVLKAQLQAAQQKYKQAIQLIETALQLYPKMHNYSVAHMLKLAWLMQDEQYQVALNYITELQTLLPFTIWKLYATHLNKLRNMAQAKLTAQQTIQ